MTRACTVFMNYASYRTGRHTQLEDGVIHELSSIENCAVLPFAVAVLSSFVHSR